MTDTPKECIQRASQGDRAAVEELLVRYLPDLVEYIDRRAVRWLQQRESASDLAQSVCREVLVRLRDGRFAFQGEPQFRQWLYRAAVMKLVERTRRGGADKRDARREVGESQAPQPADLGPTPSQYAVFHEDLDRFREAFSSLTPRSQDVIALKLIEGFTHQEIAAKLGVNESHSRVLLARALAELAQRGVGT